MWLDGRVTKLMTILLIISIVMVIMLPSMVSALSGFGDYISEKSLGNGVDESLYLGNGINGLIVLGSIPIISTGSASSSSAGDVVTMIITGNLQNLNGIPRANVWFQWGYSPIMVFNTTVVTVTTAGEQTAIINPDAGSTVYYRFLSSTDGIAYGSIRSLSAVGGGHGVSYWLLNTLLPIVFASVIIIAVLLLTGNPILALISSVIGLAGFYIVLTLVSSF